MIYCFFLIILVIVKLNKAKTNENKFGNECLIHNKQYSHEYLYTSDDKNIDQLYKRNVYTYPLDKINDFEKIRWNIIKIGNSNERFLIKSNLYNEFLCASDKYNDLFDMRLVIKRLKMDIRLFLNSSRCEWKIKEIKNKLSNQSVYTIWNLEYNRPLYAASFLFNREINKRNIFLWYKSKTDSEKFKWFIDCRRGNYQWI
jgi:hypothetical protein